MARISTYGNDTDIQANDRWIGTNSTDGNTMNFTAQQLGYFYSISGLADSGKLTFGYEYAGQFVQGTSDVSQRGALFYSGTTTPDPSGLTNIYISRFTTQNLDIQPISQVFLDDIIKITSLATANDTRYAVYEVTSVTDILDANGATIGYDLGLSILVKNTVPASSGDLGTGVITLSPLGDSSTTPRSANPVTDLEFILDNTTNPVELKLQARLLDGSLIVSNGFNDLGFGRILNGLGNPNNSVVGFLNDLFLDTSANVLYGPLTAEGSNWGTGVSLVGPQGNAGADGMDGAAGAQGIQGVMGVQGIPGTPGAKGDMGDMGLQGDQGPRGLFDLEIYQVATAQPLNPTGGSYNIDTGVLTPPTGWQTFIQTPSAGETLYESRSQINPTVGGTVVPVWSPVFTAGGVGPTGQTGVSVTNAVVTNGMLTFTLSDGTTFGPFNVAGPQGQQGPAGAQGPQGVQGVQGDQGATGPQGANGTNGTDGVGVGSLREQQNANRSTSVTLVNTDGTDIVPSFTVQAGLTGATGPAGADGNTRLTLQDEGVTIEENVDLLNFTGDGVVLQDVIINLATITFTTSGGINAFETVRYRGDGIFPPAGQTGGFVTTITAGSLVPSDVVFATTASTGLAIGFYETPNNQGGSTILCVANNVPALQVLLNNAFETQFQPTPLAGIATASLISITSPVVSGAVNGVLQVRITVFYQTDITQVDAAAQPPGPSSVVVNNDAVGSISVFVPGFSTQFKGQDRGALGTLNFDGDAVDSVTNNTSTGVTTVEINDNQYTFIDQTNIGKETLGINFTVETPDPSKPHEINVRADGDTRDLIVNANPTNMPPIVGDLTTIQIASEVYRVAGGGTGTGIVSIAINTVGQDVPASVIAVISATEQYYNKSGATITGVTTSTDFTVATDWTRVGDGNGTQYQDDAVNIGGADIRTLNVTGSADVTVLNGVATLNVRTGGSGSTDLGYTPDLTTGIVTSSSGTNATIPAAVGQTSPTLPNTGSAGLMTNADKFKLDNLPFILGRPITNWNEVITVFDPSITYNLGDFVLYTDSTTPATFTHGIYEARVANPSDTLSDRTQWDLVIATGETDAVITEYGVNETYAAGRYVYFYSLSSITPMNGIYVSNVIIDNPSLQPLTDATAWTRVANWDVLGNVQGDFGTSPATTDNPSPTDPAFIKNKPTFVDDDTSGSLRTIRAISFSGTNDNEIVFSDGTNTRTYNPGTSTGNQLPGDWDLPEGGTDVNRIENKPLFVNSNGNQIIKRFEVVDSGNTLRLSSIAPSSGTTETLDFTPSSLSGSLTYSDIILSGAIGNDSSGNPVFSTGGIDSNGSAASFYTYQSVPNTAGSPTTYFRILDADGLGETVRVQNAQSGTIFATKSYSFVI